MQQLSQSATRRRLAVPAHQLGHLGLGQLLAVKHSCNELIEVDAIRVGVNL